MENYVKDSAKRGHSMIVNRQKAYNIAEMGNKKNEDAYWIFKQKPYYMSGGDKNGCNAERN